MDPWDHELCCLVLSCAVCLSVFSVLSLTCFYSVCVPCNAPRICTSALEDGLGCTGCPLQARSDYTLDCRLDKTRPDCSQTAAGYRLTRLWAAGGMLYIRCMAISHQSISNDRRFGVTTTRKNAFNLFNLRIYFETVRLCGSELSAVHGLVWTCLHKYRNDTRLDEAERLKRQVPPACMPYVTAGTVVCLLLSRSGPLSDFALCRLYILAAIVPCGTECGGS